MSLNKYTRILVVDDVESVRELICDKLRTQGLIDVETAIDGLNAWELIQNRYDEAKAFDLIISDWSMPKMNGLELLTAVRTSSKYEETPFLMVTTCGEKDVVLDAISAGVSSYIMKPIDDKILFEKISQIMKK
jgi:two-component system chemotaxis response regulator CheY